MPFEPTIPDEPAEPQVTAGRVDVTDSFDREPGEPVMVEAVAESEDQLQRAAIDEVEAVLDEVEQALARLDDGTYGQCGQCGGSIDDDRLVAAPAVRRCDGCDGSVEAVGEPVGTF